MGGGAVGTISLGELLSALGPASGWSVLLFVFWLIVIKDTLITKRQHDQIVEQYVQRLADKDETHRAQLADKDVAHNMQISFMRERIAVAEEEASTWRSIADKSVTSTVIATETVGKVIKRPAP